jgi:flagellin
MKNNQSQKLFALAAAMAFVLAFPAKADLVANGGFETGDLTGWTHSGNLGFSSVVTSPIHSGTYAYSNGAVGSLAFISQDLTTTPGDSYTLDFWLESPGGTPSEFQVIWGGATVLDVTDLGTFGYTEYTFTGLTATSSSTSLTFGLRQDPSFLGLDDVSVQASGVPDSTFTASLLGFGLLGLAALRRKLR